MQNQIYSYVNKIFSKHQCRVRKAFSVQHCLLAVIEKWHQSLDSGGQAGFASALLPEHVQKVILKLNGITPENRTVIEDVTSTRKRDTKKLQKASKLPIVVRKKHPENKSVFSSSKSLAGMKREEEILYYS